MAKLTLQDVTQFNEAAVTLINANNDLVQEALENTMSRDGTSPNAMAANLDMDGFRILNLPAPAGSLDPVRFIDLTEAFELTGVAVPAQTGNANKFLSTDGTNLFWADAGDVTINDTDVVDTGRFAILASNETVTGNWTYNGTLTLNGAVTIDDDLDITGDLAVDGDAALAEGTVRSLPIGYRDIPRVDFSTNQVVVLSMCGKMLKHTSGSTHSVTFPNGGTDLDFADADGYAILVVNSGAGAVTLVGDSGVTMRWAGVGTTGTRTLAQYGEALVKMISATEWWVSGSGLT